MKLYRVEFTGSCYVMADDEEDALQIALDAARNPDDAGVMVDGADEVGFRHKPDKEWATAIPYGGDRLTVAQIIAAMEPVEPKDTVTLSLFGEG